MAVKIHLLMTCFLTQSRIQAEGYYGYDLHQDKFAQLLSTLYTLKRIPFNSLDFRFSLDHDFADHALQLEGAIRSWFPRAGCVGERLEHYDAWKSAVASIPEDIDWVLLMANHDHVFLGEGHEEFFAYLGALSEEGRYDIAHVSHWTEALGWRITKSAMSRSTTPQLEFFSEGTIGTVAVKRATLDNWFSEDFTGGKRFVRPDNPFGPSVQFNPKRQSLPMKEFFRHLDGYGHVGLSAPFTSSLRPCASLAEDVVVTRDYRFGNLGDSDVDLLRTPTFYPEFSGSKLEISNLLYLATGYRVRVGVVLALLRASKAGFADKAHLVLTLLATSRFWRSARGPLSSLKGLFVGAK